MPLEVPELGGGNPQLQRALAKIVQLEQKKLDKVDTKIQKIDNKMNLVKDLKTKFTEIRDSVAPFKSVKDFRDLIGISSHPDILAATTIDKNLAEPSTYEIEVLGLASTPSMMTSGMPDRDKSEIGVGYVSFTTPNGETKDIYINSSNNTLNGMAAAINSSGTGVRAHVVNDGTDSDEPWRLVISGEKGGWKNDFKWADFNFLDGDFDVDAERSKSATSATIKLNGQPLYVDENNVKDLIPGVTFDLKRVQEGQIVKLEIKPDLEKIETKAKTMVDKLNAALSFIKSQNDLNTQSRSDPTKALGGDVALQTVESQLHRIIQSTVENADEKTITRIGDLGIVFNKNGTLDYDPKKFQSALENKFTEVAELLSGDTQLNGFAYRVVSLVEGVVRSGDGSLTIREQGFRNVKDGLTADKEKQTTRAEGRVQRAREQFGKAEMAMQRMQQMGSGIAGLIQGGPG